MDNEDGMFRLKDRIKPISQETVRYQMHQRICFEVRGRNLNPDRVNPLLDKLYDLLKGHRCDSPPIKAYVSTLSDFEVEEIDTSLVRGSYLLSWEVLDLEKSGSADRFNNSIRPLVTRKMMNVWLSNNEKYSKRITISIVNSCFSGDIKRGVWPRPRF